MSTPDGRATSNRAWMLALPWPHRCPECRKWTLGALEGITRIRFSVCGYCAAGEWK